LRTHNTSTFCLSQDKNIKLHNLLNLKEINKNNFLSSELVHVDMPPVKRLTLKEYKFLVVSWIASLAPQNQVLESIKLVTFNLVIGKKKRLSRSYFTKCLGINKSTVSAHNTLMALEGIIDVQHFFNEINGYSCKFPLVLAGIFGYVNSMEWESATLTNYLFNKSSEITKIAMLIEFGSECFRTANQQENENPSETLRKSRLWDEIVGSSPTTAHLYSVHG